MRDKVFLPADILLPQGVDMTRWSVIACDQFSSQKDYWERVDAFVGTSPSTLRLILPEAYLQERRQEESARIIAATMRAYLESGLFRVYRKSYIYVERTLSTGAVRRGLVGMLDLEQYDFTPGAAAPVRASEHTILERLPARVAIRRGAPLELPHAMALIDDPDRIVIEPLGKWKDLMTCLYDFELMEGGGAIKGWLVQGEMAMQVMRALRDLPAREGVRVVVGDGNHSLAAAKVMWEEMKASLPETERRVHPARYALLELNNVYDPAIVFEAIHRIVFCPDPGALLEEARRVLIPGEGEAFAVRYLSKNEEGVLTIRAGSIGEMIGRLQAFLDDFARRHGCGIDYIHGEETVTEMARGEGAVGFILPAMRKEGFFRTVEAGTVFPKKSFSIGHARDKRYYLEARRIDRAQGRSD